MNKFRVFLCSLAIAGFAAGGAQAQTIDQQDKIARYQSDVKSAADLLNQRCGSKVEVQIDWASFAKEDWQKQNPRSWCLQPLPSIGLKCQSSAAFKTAFAGKVQTYSCKDGSAGNPLFTLKDGNLNYSIDWTTSGRIEDQVISYLNSNLQ